MAKTTNNLANRNSTLDITRIISVLLVMMVHFFLYTGFYSEPMVGPTMFLMCFMRTFFSACVPMFLLLSGYLMGKKTVSKKHYFGISKTLLTYVMAAIACVVYKAIHYHTQFEFKTLILSFFDFTAAQYAWYVEMYIGLFLLVPFLNLIYNNLSKKRHKQLLVLTMIFLTAVPSLFNVYNLVDMSWWANPSVSDTFNSVLPDWWIGFYPVTFYFTGCYLREFGLNLKTKTVALLLVLTTVLFTGYNFWRSYGTGFITSQYAYWYGFQPYVTATLLFELCTRIKSDNYSSSTKYVLWKISDLVLCMYLVSYIFDSYIYAKLNALVPVMQDRIKWFVPCVAFVFVCSLVLSLVLHFLEDVLRALYNIFVKFIKQLRNNNPQSVVDLCFMVLMIAAVVLSVWKAPFGFGGNDEAFYLTVPHRLTLGDTMFRDEWHLSQMSGFITMPLVFLYRLIVGSTDGIMLAFRFFYIILHCLVVVFAYKRLRKHGYVAAIGLALYFVYTPYNIMALSYNTMALDLLLLSGVLLATSDKAKKVELALSGVCFAAAVLCCPYLVIVYVIYAVCAVINTALKNSQNKKCAIHRDIFSLKTFMWFTLGVSALAVIFAVYLALTCGFKAVIENLPLMLQDPEHPQLGVFAKLKGYFTGIYKCHSRFEISIISYAVLLLCMTVDRDRKNHRAFYLTLSAIVAVMSYFMFYPTVTTIYYNAIMVPMIFLGITSYILCEKKPQEIFCTIFMGGVLHSVCVTMSSNQYFYIIAVALALTNIASFVFLAQVLREMKERPDEVGYGEFIRKGTVLAVTLTIAIFGCMLITSKTQHCFWEPTTKLLDTRITSGPAKGLYTSKNNAAAYESICADLESYNGDFEGDILMLTERTWCYLAVDDMPFGSFSAWISGENATALNRLDTFYSVNPDKVPEYIYIPKLSKLDTASLAYTAQTKGYALIETDTGYKLERNIAAN